MVDKVFQGGLCREVVFEIMEHKVLVKRGGYCFHFIDNNMPIKRIWSFHSNGKKVMPDTVGYTNSYCRKVVSNS